MEPLDKNVKNRIKINAVIVPDLKISQICAKIWHSGKRLHVVTLEMLKENIWNCLKGIYT